MSHLPLEKHAEALPMLDVYLPMMKSAAIISAAQLGLFEALSAGPLTSPELAKATGTTESSVQRLADFLVTLNYLERHHDGTLANSAHATRWFTRTGQVDYTAGLVWTGAAWNLMATLTDAVRRGGPASSLWDQMVADPTLGPTFSRYMKAFAHHLSPDIVEAVPLPLSAKRLLDLGGSHGLHSMAFCRRYPALKATLVDLESALTETKGHLEQAGLSERVTLVPGDLNHTPWGDGFDVALYLSVAHNQTAVDNREAFARIARALVPGGLVIVHEYLADEPPSAYNAAFRLTLLVETGTRTWSVDELSTWLREAGFSAPTRLDLTPREKGSLLVATKL